MRSSSLIFACFVGLASSKKPSGYLTGWNFGNLAARSQAEDGGLGFCKYVVWRLCLVAELTISLLRVPCAGFHTRCLFRWTGTAPPFPGHAARTASANRLPQLRIPRASDFAQAMMPLATARARTVTVSLVGSIGSYGGYCHIRLLHQHQHLPQTDQLLLYRYCTCHLQVSTSNCRLRRRSRRLLRFSAAAAVPPAAAVAAVAEAAALLQHWR
jgi:hypothetical protein